MVLAVRVDVDNPFGLSTRFRRLLNRVSINYGFVPKLSKLGYLDNSIQLLQRLGQSGIQATWFFRTVSAPTKALLPFFSDLQQSLGLHAERTNTFETFLGELKLWEKRLGKRPGGFTKHGSGELKLSRMHDPSYIPEKLLDFGKRAGLRFFLGNDHQYLNPYSEHDGFIYAPSVFWLDRTSLYGKSFSIDSFIDDAKKRGW